MSRGRGGAAAGLALAAAGMIYSRLTGRGEASQQSFEPPPVPADAAGGASTAEVDHARAELAAELARRASRSER